jgi:hypothetical protein
MNTQTISLNMVVYLVLIYNRMTLETTLVMLL